MTVGYWTARQSCTRSRNDSSANETRLLEKVHRNSHVNLMRAKLWAIVECKTDVGLRRQELICGMNAQTGDGFPFGLVLSADWAEDYGWKNCVLSAMQFPNNVNSECRLDDEEIIRTGSERIRSRPAMKRCTRHRLANDSCSGLGGAPFLVEDGKRGEHIAANLDAVAGSCLCKMPRGAIRACQAWRNQNNPVMAENSGYLGIRDWWRTSKRSYIM